MQYKNIEVHNVAHLIECENGGVSWLRVPQKIYDSMESDQGKRMCHNFTGVELRFVMKSDSAVIKLGSLTDKETHINFNVFFGDVSGLSGDEVHPNIYGIQQIADRMTKRIRGCF